MKRFFTQLNPRKLNYRKLNLRKLNLRKLNLRKLMPTFLGMTSAVCLVMVGMVIPSNGARGLELLNIALDTILFIISGIMYFFLIYIMGKLATWGGKIIVYVASLSGFTTIPVIIESWNMVRDLANMFFIVILLFIAFGTLFRVEAYSWKKLLPKMIFAAILVNFSRAIVGVVVDATQVIMLTFVAAIAPATQQGLVMAFRLNELFKLSEIAPGVESSVDAKKNFDASGAKVRALGIAVAGMMLGVMVMVEFVYVVVLVGRMAMIWFLTVLSPIAFASMVLPASEKYYKQWWEMLGRYAMIGPMIMFFFWLSMFIAVKSGDEIKSNTGLTGIISDEEIDKLGKGPSAEESAGLKTGALDTATVVGFLVSTMMLMAGLKMAQDNSSELGSIVSKASQVGSWVAKAPLRYGAKPALSYLNDRQAIITGRDLNLVRAAGRWKEGIAENRKRREMKIEAKAGELYQKGSITAGVLGAGQAVAEKGVTIDQFRGVGQIPLIGGWLRKKFGIQGLGMEAGFQRAMKDEASGESEQAKAEKTYTTEKQNLDKQYMTVTEYERRQKEAKAEVGAVEGIKNSGTINLEDNTHREFLTDYKKGLEGKLADKTTSSDNRSSIGKELAKLEELLNKTVEKGKGTMSLDDIDLTFNAGGVDAEKNFVDKKKAAAQEYTDRAEDSERTNKGTLHLQGQVQVFVKEKLKDQQAVIDAAKEKVKEAKVRRKKWSPAFVSSTEQKQRAIVKEWKSKITSTDSGELKDMWEMAIKSKNGAMAAAIYERLCETGNGNESMRDDVYGYTGVKNIYEQLKKAGLSDQAAMSSVHAGGQAAKAVNHTPLSEMTETRGGRIVFRDFATYIKNALAETNKINALQLGRTQTRLGIGETGVFAKDGSVHHDHAPFIINEAVRIQEQKDTAGKIQMTPDKLKLLLEKNKNGERVRFKMYKDEVKRVHEAEGERLLNDLIERNHHLLEE